MIVLVAKSGEYSIQRGSQHLQQQARKTAVISTAKSDAVDAEDMAEVRNRKHEALRLSPVATRDICVLTFKIHPISFIMSFIDDLPIMSNGSKAIFQTMPIDIIYIVFDQLALPDGSPDIETLLGTLPHVSSSISEKALSYIKSYWHLSTSSVVPLIE
ncbi:hypothetical protein N7457_008462 [Penicillium paradoxum]|uniref:uncharacterized protein n=1 Tax=Penicillium paradoxum TaxID=176176 RepID=UPI0025480B54|nr:uncharacterized protein N7457_008462 [Penicillium paradoxum]KAJ5773566.1 hypothetical protein N7457_008462 [Penicillium paradoxum]